MYSAAIDIRAAAADDSIIELERKRRAPEDLEDVEELPEDQLAVEARTVDDMSVDEAKTQKKLGHFRVRPYLHHPFHVKPAERYYFLLSNRKKKSFIYQFRSFHFNVVTCLKRYISSFIPRRQFKKLDVVKI